MNMCDHHLFIIIVPNDWTITVNQDDNGSNRVRVKILLSDDEEIHCIF